MLTIATLFSGGGGVECGAKMAGFTPIYAVEYDPKIAAIYRVNHGDHVKACRVEDASPFELQTIPTVLWASPVCKNFSQAKKDGTEQGHDLSSADAICQFLEVLRPPFFVLENVIGYRASQSFKRIIQKLEVLGYWIDAKIVNAADYGVPQTRRRLILRASRDGFLYPLPMAGEWIGWYQAIEDLVPTLPESKFAPWQLARLPEDIFQRVFIIDGQANRQGKAIIIRQGDSPMYTISASIEKRPARAWLAHGNVVSLNIPALARLQLFPDDYQFSGRNALDATIIGNSVPPLLAKVILLSLQAA